MGLGSFLPAALSKTRNLFSGIAQLFSFKGKVDQKFLEELEKRLFPADVGTFATQEIVNRVKAAYQDKEVVGNEMKDFVKAQLKTLLTAPSQGLSMAATGPTVVMIAGVNGAGKTTSIAKLAKHCMNEKKKVMVAACDTFRA